MKSLIQIAAIAYAPLAGAALAASQTFSDPMPALAAGDVTTFASSDIDGDGHTDLITGSYGYADVLWHRRVPGGTLAPPLVIAQRPGAGLDVADIDGDGDLDVLYCGSRPGLGIIAGWAENQDGLGGSWTIHDVYIDITNGTNSYISAARLIDYNADGLLDIVLAQPGLGRIVLLLNDQGFSIDGTLQNTESRSLEVADLNGDGSEDLVVGDVSSGHVLYYPIAPNGGGFGSAVTISSGHQYPGEILAGNFLGVAAVAVADGLLGETRIGSQVVHACSGGAGQWSVQAIASGELLGGGALDLVSICFNNLDNNTLVVNSGSTGWPLIETHYIYDISNPAAAICFDLEGDGDLDILVGPESPSESVVALMNTTNTLLDCDSDGLPDIAELDCNANNLPDSCEIANNPVLDQDLNGILDVCEANGPLFVRNPDTGRLFTAIAPDTWIGARAYGTVNELYLATVENQDLGTWLRQTFDLPVYWIGYNDAAIEGQFTWASGRSAAYENWAPGAPNSFAPDQDFAAVDGSMGLWDTHFANSTFPAIMETMSIDCDGNLILDDEEIAADPLLDLDGDGQLDTCVSPNYCVGGINSTGLSGVMGVSGTPFLIDNDLTLEATQLPPGQWSYFVMSASQAYIPGFGGSQGNLCVGAPIVRFNQGGGPGGQIAQTSAAGTRHYTLDFANLPQQIVFQPGETWNFQLWFRDQNPGLTSNTTDGISVMFR